MVQWKAERFVVLFGKKQLNCRRIGPLAAETAAVHAFRRPTGLAVAGALSSRQGGWERVTVCPARTRSQERGNGHMRRLVIAMALLLPSVAVAQQGVVEITPMVGIRRGGGVIVEDRAFQDRNVNVDLATEGSFGVRIGVGLSSRLQLEFMADRQNGQMKDNKGLFGEQPGGFVPILSTNILDFNVTYYHLGLLWHFTPAPNGWYVVLSAGDARIEPKSPLESVDRFSASVGAGVKVELNEHSSLRFEGRLFRTQTGNLPAAVQQLNSRDCYQGGPCTYTYRYSDTLQQGQLSVGYAIRF